ncbi:MAG: hypothetical protein P8174_01600, partial [Gemmatimonadota bacterium]
MKRGTMMRRLFLGVGLCLIVTQTSCRAGGHAPGVLLSDSAGVPIATIVSLPPLDDPAWKWTLKLDWSLPTVDSAGQPLVYDPGNMTPLADGTVVVADAASPHLVVVDPASRAVVRRFGRQGHGPGEVVAADLVWTGPDGDLRVGDALNQRITRFARDGAVVSELSLVRVGGARGIGKWQAFTGAADVIAHIWQVTDFATNALTDSLARVDPATGEMRVFMALPPRPPPTGQRYSPLFEPRSLWTALPSGDVVVGNTHQAAFRVYGRDGVLRREVRLPLKPRPIPESEKAKLLEDFARAVRRPSASLPQDAGDQYPITNRLYPVNDTVFAMYQTYLSGASSDPGLPSGQTVWRLVSTTGRYCGTVWLPRRFAVNWWRHGRML